MSNDSVAYLQKLDFLLKTSSESTTETRQEFLGKSSYTERQKAFERVSNETDVELKIDTESLMSIY